MKRNSGIIGPLKNTSTTLAKGIHDLHDVHIKRSETKWPRLRHFVSITPSVTTVTEGNTMTFTIVTEDVPNDTNLIYTITTISGTTMVDADFFASPNDGGVQGTFTTTNDSTVLTFGLVAEQSPGVTENNVFRLLIKYSNFGATLLESANITVTDAVSFGTDIRSAFYEISNRVIYLSGVGDYTGAYDVGEIQQAYSGSARVYIALKCTTSTTYYNDICIAAVQVLNSSNVIQQTWNFSSSSNNSWQTTTSAINANNSSLLSSYLTPSQAAAYSYSSMSTTNNINRIGIATSTGSYTTGMADGIANSTTTAYSVGNSQVSQSSGTYYFYREVSGASRYSHAVARSPSYSFSSGDKIRVVHAVTTPTSQSSSININDSIWIGVY